MKRGEVWTIRDRRYASKARPAVIVSAATDLDSVIVCLFTSSTNTAVPSRPHIASSAENGLNVASFVMTDKIASVRSTELGEHVGHLTDFQMHEISRSLAEILRITPKDVT